MVRRLLIGVALVLLVLLPVGASAQPKPPTPPGQAQAAGDGPNVERIVVIGVGVLVGVVAGEVLGGTDVLTLLAGIAGGYAGAWWYDSGDRVHANLRQPAAVAATWQPGDLALAR